MATSWEGVCALAERLPDAVLGQAHEGSPAWYAGRHQFARLRWDDDREVLQFWSGDMSLGDALAGAGGAYLRIDVFRYRVSVWAYLDQLDLREAAELVLDSYAVRGGPRRAAAVDEAHYFAYITAER